MDARMRAYSYIYSAGREREEPTARGLAPIKRETARACKGAKIGV